MVTFRFYLVSIVAFFLALAVGVVVGSVLDEGISDSLKDRLEGVERNLNDTVASIDDKNREIDALQRYAEASAPFAVDNRLPGSTTLVVAEPGIDSAPVEDLVLRFRQSGSHVAGIVWLDARWDLADDEDKGRFGELTDTATSSVEQLHRSVWEQVLDSRTADSGAATTTTTEDVTDTTDTTDVTGEDTPTTPTTTIDPTDPTRTALDVFEDPLLVELADAGFLRLVEIDGDDPAGGSQLNVVTVTGTESDLETPGSAAVALTDQAATLEVPTVLSEIYNDDSSDSEDPPERGTIVRPATDKVTSTFSTVDDLDLIAGRVATVLAVAALRDGQVGHFGYGPDVDGVLPRWLGP
ncbi:hypothetical protein BH10ACT3_BH10ACT3_13730 [soil metagenome]